MRPVISKHAEEDHGTDDRPRQDGAQPFPRTITSWFPLLPRPRPPCQALHLRIDEIRRLADAASRGPDEIQLTSAAEALNKAALIASDCGLNYLAQRLCWRQFAIFYAAAPLTAQAAKFALQPIVNLGRLATRDGDNVRAYQIFENTYHAATHETTTKIDGKDIDFQQFLNTAADRQECRKFLWTILLADGTRTLTKAGRWNDALRHIERHKGIGKRMLDGRQVAILAHYAAGDYQAAIDLVDASYTPEPWEQAVAACLRTLCLTASGQPAGTSADAMVNAYLRVPPSREHLVFHTRLGLCTIDLATGHNRSLVIAHVIRDAVAGADANSAADVLAHDLCQSHLTQTDKDALAQTVKLSGLGRGTIPADQLNNLTTAVTSSEACLTRMLTPDR